MRIIVESGSTKADWMLIDDLGSKALTTIGFNPFFHTKEDILIELNDQLELDLIKEDVTELHFYGAGCSSRQLNKTIQEGLESFFTHAIVTVEHDLLAAAIALYEEEPLISCILGTGSNSCYFDGNNIKEKSPALGYILGDEGSGSYFGKRILRDFLYGRLPDKLNKEFRDLGTTKRSVQENVYMRSNANVYIASHAPIIVRNMDISYCQELVREGFREFINLHVMPFEESKRCKVSFVGSVASLLQNELKAVCEEEGLQFGKTVRRPLENLVKHHTGKVLSTKDKVALNFNNN